MKHFEDLSDWTEELELSLIQVKFTPYLQSVSKEIVLFPIFLYLNAYHPGPAIIKRLVNVSVGQTLSMYTYGKLWSRRGLFRDILIGTMFSWESVRSNFLYHSKHWILLLKNCWRRTIKKLVI